MALTIAAAACDAFLPHRLVQNGPIGATCPNTQGAVGHVQIALIIAAVAAAAVSLAGAIASGARGHQRMPATTLGVIAAFVPYIAVGALIIPRLCDYS